MPGAPQPFDFRAGSSGTAHVGRNDTPAGVSQFTGDDVAGFVIFIATGPSDASNYRCLRPGQLLIAFAGIGGTQVVNLLKTVTVPGHRPDAMHPPVPLSPRQLRRYEIATVALQSSGPDQTSYCAF